MEATMSTFKKQELPKKRGRANYSKIYFEEWVLLEEAQEVIKSTTSMNAIYKECFSPWLESRGTSLSYVSFNKLFKEYLSENKIDRQKEATKAIQQFDKAVRLPYEEKFEMVATYSDMIKQGYINSAIIFGTAGIGKDHTVESVLGDDAVYYKGGIKGTYDLVKILYEHRKNSLLVFSDFDSCIKNIDQRNIMKAALEDKDKRYINWGDHVKEAKKKSIPSKFEFTSGVVFISNIKRFDPALKSRSVPVDLNLTKNEILNRIKDKIEEFMPKIPLKIKMEVLDYIISIKSDVRKIDFRQFKFSVATYIAHKNDKAKWQRWVKQLLNT